jgi:hypothetical protein
MALAQWTRAVFYASFGTQFGMAGCDAAPMAELHEFFHCEFSGEGEHAVQHG